MANSNTLSCEGQSLECVAQVGAELPPIAPYSPPELCEGNWQITGHDDLCATNEANQQASYIAESLNISGAPINVYPLRGIHQQGSGSVLGTGTIIGSQSAPGFPLSGVNAGGLWRSFYTGTAVSTAGVFIGVDFGIKLLSTISTSEYAPAAPKWTNVGAIVLTQSNTPNYFAQQVRVDTANGTVTAAAPAFSGNGNGGITINGVGLEALQATVLAQAISPNTFSCYAQLPSGTVVSLGTALLGVPFYSTFLNFTIMPGSVPFDAGDMFSTVLSYVWCRAGVYNIVQSPSPQVLGFNTVLKVAAVRISPILFSGTGSWEVEALDVLDSTPTAIGNIQDLFFNENRDRDYNPVPTPLKVQYTPADSINDLSKFGLSILDQYVFTLAFATMVAALGRPIVVGDIIEVIPELQYDHNLQPVRKFLEVTDTGWSSAGFSPSYSPIVYRFAAQQAMPSQETRDIFGTLNTAKYLQTDQLFGSGQIDTTPLTRTEEISREAADAVPETGSDDNRSVKGVVSRVPLPPRNKKGELFQSCTPPSHPNVYIEDALPPNGLPYTEGYSLPPTAGVADGTYFRLYYPDSVNIAPRLYRFSLVKNAWLFLEQDRRGEYVSAKPSLQKILQSTTSTPLNKKRT